MPMSGIGGDEVHYVQYHKKISGAVEV